jgi:hypothetical protein
MNLLCHHATVRPTIARCAEQIASYRAREHRHSSTGIGMHFWYCVLGDIGHVMISRVQTHFQLWDINEEFDVRIGNVQMTPTRAEIHAICRATQSGSHLSFAKLPKPKIITPNP